MSLNALAMFGPQCEDIRAKNKAHSKLQTLKFRGRKLRQLNRH